MLNSVVQIKIPILSNATIVGGCPLFSAVRHRSLWAVIGSERYLARRSLMIDLLFVPSAILYAFAPVLVLIAVTEAHSVPDLR